MKNSELFHDTVSILVKAYLNDTLVHGSCAACAVGNIIAARNGFKLLINPNDKNNFIWKDQHRTVYTGAWHYALVEYRDGDAVISPNGVHHIKSTGYNISEINLIEFAFEGARFQGAKEEWMYNGMLAVVDVLCQIHEMPEVVKTETKLLFQK